MPAIVVELLHNFAHKCTVAGHGHIYTLSTVQTFEIPNTAGSLRGWLPARGQEEPA